MDKKDIQISQNKCFKARDTFILNPIPTGLFHVITVYGLIQSIADRTRVIGLPFLSQFFS